jgi:general secretion pathway protein K
MARSQQHGAAIVLAMGIVAMAAIAATAIMLTQSTWSRQIELGIDHRQAHHLVPAGVDWARRILSDDRRSSGVDHLGELWAVRLPPTAIANGTVAGYVEDQQGLFNLNNLVRAGTTSPAQLALLRRLFVMLDLSPALADAVADWIDADNIVQGAGGAEDDYYLALESPYLAANRPLVDLDELASIRGFDATVMARVRPFVTALPRFTAVNVNTAPPEVLAAIVDGIDIDTARALVGERERRYFRTTEDFSSRVPRGVIVPMQEITVGSDFFMVTLRVTSGETESRGKALLRRDDTGWPAIVWRKYS